MTLRAALAKLQERLPVRANPALASAVHWTPSENLPIHRWFRYREGFSPYLLNHFPNAKCRLDPFCGCGTTLLESVKHGVQSYGIDLNPLATFVTRVKTRRYTRLERETFVNLYRLATRRSRKASPVDTPPYALLSKLFLPESLYALLQFRASIEEISSGKLRSLLLIAWLSVLEDCSNVFKEGNGLKYRNKRRKPGKYETIPDSEWIPRYFGDDIRGFVEAKWETKCEQIAEDIERSPLASGFTPKLRTASCLQKEKLDFGTKFDFVVFSPPYANRFDYFEAFKIELWMGGFVETSSDMAGLRARSMRNNLAAAKYDASERWEPLAPFLRAMDPEASSVRMGIKATLEGYFHDMRTLLRNLYPVLSRRAKIVIVVGNSAYAKSIIPTDVLIARLGQEERYRVVGISVARHLHVSSQQRSALSHLEEFMRESVIVMEKP